MEFEWDEQKRLANLAKHGIDFEDAIHIFAGHGLVRRSDRDGERRFVAVGEVQGRVVAVVYTVRNEVYRVISARRGTRNEARNYNDRKTAPGG
jgi:uncharacterized DUF497 family protein